jgi:hypothetical protein
VRRQEFVSKQEGRGEGEGEMEVGIILQLVEDRRAWSWAYRANPHVSGASLQNLPVDDLLGLGVLDLNRVQVDVTLHPFTNEDNVYNRERQATGELWARQQLPLRCS